MGVGGGLGFRDRGSGMVNMLGKVGRIRLIKLGRFKQVLLDLSKFS